MTGNLIIGIFFLIVVAIIIWWDMIKTRANAESKRKELEEDKQKEEL